LKDGTELIGSWQNGRRNGQGSVSGPFLEHLGVQMLAGNYVDGVLSGIGRIHMSDESVREGWFFGGRADGPFRGAVKVVCFVFLLILPLLVFRWGFNLLSITGPQENRGRLMRAFVFSFAASNRRNKCRYSSLLGVKSCNHKFLLICNISIIPGFWSSVAWPL
jgi:hypothetical protein